MMQKDHKMEDQKTELPCQTRTTTAPSPVRAVITWLVEADREFRVAQSMVDETKRRG